MIKKDLKDSEIMSGILDALKVKVTDFSRTLGYDSYNSVYNVVKGISNISKKMESRILEHYPEVSVLYLKKGKGEPLRAGSSLTAQNHILGNYNPVVPESSNDELRLKLSQIERDILESKIYLKRILDILEKK